MLQRIRGTQDFTDLTLFNFLSAVARAHLTHYGFNEVMTPILEPTDLFRRSLGLNTDVVTKEMFTVKAGENEEAICLRPEATASIMRAFFNNGIQERPWRVFSLGPIFRHERPQKGRYRQFHQLSIEMIGAGTIMQDAEFIAMLDTFISENLRLDSYALLLNFLGTAEDRENYKRALYAFLEKQDNLPRAIQERKETNLLRIFDLKDEECKKALEHAPVLTDSLCAESRAEWDNLRSLLDQLSISYVHDPRLVRGLDYYNKTVFEFSSLDLGAQNAFCGGGRYDHLSIALGEKEPVPSMGAAFGVERLLMLLEARKDKLALPQKPPLIVLIPLAPEQQLLALIAAQELRAVGICCEALLEGASVKSMMRRANKLGAQYTILMGEDEQKGNYITLKDMVSGTEEKVKQGDMVEQVKARVS
ncbi:TPA: histidine--tRNA ligase [Candidatus Dependentiae bacterium]|nr:MAG: Histidine-tRNA ligase [candidate division TM6 bacterium GW2011_GWF2_43_87]HBL98129.1 histidine--tRNA ligase [Candidatus Dependentiae bacterium]